MIKYNQAEKWLIINISEYYKIQ